MPNPSRKLAVLAAVGPTFTWYDIDVEACTLRPRATSSAPQNVQYLWPSPDRKYVYVASTNQGPRKEAPGGEHFITAFRVDAATASLVPHGRSVNLPHRPVHLTLSTDGKFAIAVYPRPAAATVHRINADGTLGAEVKQPATLDLGIFPHQVRMTPSGRRAIIVTRGNDATKTAPEDPGALKTMDMQEGVLANHHSASPNGGYGFGPRHIDFDASGRWLYASLERQNKLAVFSMQDDTPSAKPVFLKDTLKDYPGHSEHAHQLVGTVHVHPRGGFVYVANRGSGYAQADGKRALMEGGVNNIAVFAIDPKSGEPALIQNEDTRGIHCRTFAFDPSGRMMVAAHILPSDVRENGVVRTVPANLTTFRVGSDGRLAFANRYDVDTGGLQQFWMGILELP